jgi:hypothetical protein
MPMPEELFDGLWATPLGAARDRTALVVPR